MDVSTSPLDTKAACHPRCLRYRARDERDAIPEGSGRGALAIVDPATTHLGAPERKLLAEALRRAEETRDVIEDALVSFGRWLLVNVFDDDAAAALEDRRDNPVWRDLLARAGGPTLRLRERMLYVALHIAAHDKRINDEAWRNLEPGRK